jgi:hypothetical protein
MYFGHGRSDRALPAAVARAVATEPFGWSHEPLDVVLRIDSDLTFTVTDDGTVPSIGPSAGPSAGTGAGTGGMPLLDRNGSLLDRRRWTLAAAAALSTRVSVEVHTGGRRWRQALAGSVPLAAPRDSGPAPGPLTQVTFELDPGYFRAGAVLPADPARLWPEVPGSVRGSFTVTDLRTADTSPPGM